MARISRKEKKKRKKKNRKREEKVKQVVIKLGSGNSGNFFMTMLKLPSIPLHSLHLGHYYPEFSIRVFRQLLSDKKAQILYDLKAKKPKSIYALAKELGRDFKAVRQDIKLLEQFGFVLLIPEKGKNNKKRLRPVLDLKKLQINIEL